ncbi:AraC-like DNA-binding protein [Clostridium acetobutylicum]|uniref:AraC-type DNA-binding domain-containing protein, transcriptional regulator n=1 Tax=Clostridium acetobutylicum (strain ATCC 824 / DSM 792 / JCM 1419 / IAM 19013 / LMG 5710 / NBRC 13948 / NRRL B-527 / VKM B-1787 / 2291 / W) TaxID=272562 RepID=Q97FC2_CLOAB|nr:MULTISPECIES: AraC family transcriptional regulator [Clostridium]AAK80762.1 AraC-type DNA-binding domain-containing protein, transcriptional regulator [Clostridium acetobutylicum ATCC 824]ADZ21863.1 AraC-type DNA-binding domain-containing protein, transcriptional regulator [Clostridium acetobutylicum EA 2018]AEI32571.1 AraC-type DNA-binding domain-containing protein [Clostridium acetobutylicum DSM 1731]AWV78825.1 AraC family transcriptional regulator [Clostridium acetobutylicum]KHD37123.1 A
MDNKKGYLNEDFQLFHLKDRKSQSFEFHYHDFNKIIIFISGKVTYLIEGKAYELKPWDILLVNNHDVHKPIIDSSKVYERIIIWANSDFIKKHNYEDCDLSNCFKLARERSFNLVRLKTELQDNMKFIINSLEQSLKSKEFGSKLFSNSLFIQLIIYLNRVHLENMYLTGKETLRYDKQIEKILKYINANLKGELSTEALAREFYMSKYYLMHKFKKETGYTLHNYVLQKRLLLSKDMIKKGDAITKAYMQCGFKDYSSFFRAFKKMFGRSPREFCNDI